MKMLGVALILLISYTVNVEGQVPRLGMSRSYIKQTFHITIPQANTIEGSTEVRFDSLSIAGAVGSGFFQFEGDRLLAFSWNQDGHDLNTAELEAREQAFHRIDSMLSTELGRPVERGSFDPRHVQVRWQQGASSTLLFLDHFELHLNILNRPIRMFYAVPETVKDSKH